MPPTFARGHQEPVGDYSDLLNVNVTRLHEYLNGAVYAST